MANFRAWSQTATGNASVAGGANTINFAEGQTPGSVNNSAREMMAQLRGVYTPSNWGWVEFSATSSVASQTSIKLAGNQTSDWTTGRRWRLKSGSSTRYGAVVSSSFTVETTVTVTVDTGSLSASHSLAALSVIDEVANHVPVFRFSANNVGLGTTSPTARLDVYTAGSGGSIINRSEGVSQVAAYRTTTDTTGPKSVLRKARGTLASETAVASGDEIGELRFQAYGGTNTRNIAGIFGFVETFTSDSDISSYLALYTSPTGGVTAVERFRIRANGDAVVTGSGGLGYGTGSGGAVTQITSRTTGVTLNKTNGAITLFTAAGSGGAQTFTVTNSTVAATDTVVVSVKSGTNVYLAFVSAVAAGSFNITFQTTGGTASDAPVFNFAVIKAVTA